MSTMGFHYTLTCHSFVNSLCSHLTGGRLICISCINRSRNIRKANWGLKERRLQSYPLKPYVNSTLDQVEWPSTKMLDKQSVKAQVWANTGLTIIQDYLIPQRRQSCQTLHKASRTSPIYIDLLPTCWVTSTCYYIYIKMTHITDTPHVPASFWISAPSGPCQKAPKRHFYSQEGAPHSVQRFLPAPSLLQ